ncbi:GNAT family N-acetyltransferase [Nocardioides marmoribigeumensis]|uniref:RimJ/RimL family protein N-acetyltransferase n=1 Tax=Nocardioides marmoribigeumensis TaxID=433649 RepID=A0ABU2BTZ9_9ACTN|nr:GNAT family N-acetyltransferase [Nocardioides marmoribigeumensis]MDR7362102.1 RimJ/RimL family protein N-acetyltransferase [Nocardioides marmoribigeumensis]
MATEVRLRDGSLAVTWALLPQDRDELARGYDALGDESKFERFLTGVPHLTAAMLHRLVDEVDGDHHVALVIFVVEGGQGTPAGVGHLIRYPDDPAAADVAVTVAEAFRGRGVATALLARLVAERPAGVERLVTTVVATNHASLAMLRRLGPTTVTDRDDRLDVVVELKGLDPQT